LLDGPGPDDGGLDAPARGFGAGEFPLELDRFNWAAFLLPLFWAVAYGAWPIAGWWLATLVLPLFLASLIGLDSATTPLSTIIAMSAISEVASGAVRLWAGSMANRLAWRREQMRLTYVDGAKPRFTDRWFAGRQRLWAIVGWMAIGVAAVGTSFVNAVAWKEYGMPQVGYAEPFVWLVGEIALALWLARAMRRDAEPPALADGSSDDPYAG
jgi:hypothetical protein